jgi:2-octaprenyl-6-methoxyphenol hydroxylase
LIEPHAQRIEQILVTDGRRPGAAPGLRLPAVLRFDAAEIADRVDGEPLGYMVENRHTRAGLAQAVKDAGIRVLAPARVVGVQADPASVAAELDDGSVLRAPLLVGSDGRGSSVRQAAGIGVVGWPYGDVGVVATVQLDRPHGGVAHEHFLPSGPFAVLPLTGDRASLVWTERAGRGAALAGAREEAFHAHLNRRFGDFIGEARLAGPRFVYPLTLELADAMTAPRIALLGDAAHGVHPIAGQGLNLGLKDCAALAEVLVDAVAIGEDIGSQAVLERYARWRRFDNVGLALATDAFNRLFSTDVAPVRLARDAGMALVNRIGPARRFFMREAGGAVGDLPKLLRGEALVS